MTKKRFVYLIAIISLFGFSITSFGLDDSELNKPGISDQEQAQKLKSAVNSILLTKYTFAWLSIKESCKEDILKFCGDKEKNIEIIECIKLNRLQVNETCNNTLLKEFGSEPLSEAKTYNGVSLPVGSRLGYNNNGDVISAFVPENFAYRGIYFKAGKVSFHPLGKGISSAKLLKDQLINNIKYTSDRMNVFFDEEGNVSNGILAEDTIVNGVSYKKDSQIRFYAPNKVKHGVLAEDTKINGVYFRKDSSIHFNNLDTVERGKLAKDTAINGLSYKKHSQIVLFGPNKVKSGVLAVDAEINGKQYQTGNRLWFNNNGSIKLVDVKSNY
jgi:hypothetical protein